MGRWPTRSPASTLTVQVPPGATEAPRVSGNSGAVQAVAIAALRVGPPSDGVSLAARLHLAATAPVSTARQPCAEIALLLAASPDLSRDSAKGKVRAG